MNDNETIRDNLEIITLVGIFIVSLVGVNPGV